MEKSPEQIYIDYKRKIINQRSAVEQFLFLFENSEIHRERIKCLEMICRIGLREDNVFKFFENLLIADIDENIRILAATCLRKLFLEKAYIPIKWAYLHEKSIFCLIELISLIADLAAMNQMCDAKSFLIDQVNKIDLFQFRNSLRINRNNTNISNLSSSLLATIIKQYLIIRHFSEKPANFTYALRTGLISKFDLSGINKNAFGWNILKKFFDFFETFESIRNLDLKDNRITEIPTSIGNLKNLVYLNLSYNDLQVLPESVGLLRNLRYLILSHNKITDLPCSIANLTHLKILDLRHNILNTIPNEINSLTNLLNLDLHGNQFENLLNVNLDLKGLKRLDLGLNRVKILPQWLINSESLKILNLGSNNIILDFGLLQKLKFLAVLNISDNNLKNVPGNVELMKSLKVLNLSNNQLISLPQELRSLKELRSLDLSWNNFTNLPEWISDLTALERLSLRGNRLKQLPSSLGNLASLKVLNLKLNKNLRKIPYSLKELQKKGLFIYK